MLFLRPWVTFLPLDAPIGRAGAGRGIVGQVAVAPVDRGRAGVRGCRGGGRGVVVGGGQAPHAGALLHDRPVR